MAIRLILADDHPVLLSGIALVCSTEPNIAVVGKATNTSAMLELLKHNPCDVLLSDYSMPGGAVGDGLAMLSFVRRSFPKVKIIVFTMIDNDAIVYEMLRLGVSLVLKKSAHMHHLISAVQGVYAGEKTLFDTSFSTFSDDMAYQPLLSLSRREVEVLRLYVHGASITQIALQLNRTKQTVSTQKSSAMKKLGLEHDADLFHFAYQKGMLHGSGILSKPSVPNLTRTTTSLPLEQSLAVG